MIYRIGFAILKTPSKETLPGKPRQCLIYDTFLPQAAATWFSPARPRWRARCLPPGLPQGERFIPLEIKSGATFGSDWAAPLRKLSALFGDAARPPWIVFGGEGQYEHEGCQVTGWRALGEAEGANPISQKPL